MPLQPLGWSYIVSRGLKRKCREQEKGAGHARLGLTGGPVITYMANLYTQTTTLETIKCNFGFYFCCCCCCCCWWWWWGGGVGGKHLRVTSAGDRPSSIPGITQPQNRLLHQLSCMPQTHTHPVILRAINV